MSFQEELRFAQRVYAQWENIRNTRREDLQDAEYTLAEIRQSLIVLAVRAWYEEHHPGAGEAVEMRTVCIPGSLNHGGVNSIHVTLPWVCPVCGGPRGAIFPALSYDGSLRMSVDGWKNECGHVDDYSSVRKEAQEALELLSSEAMT